jgi:VIT1/CCC1 family predicted Fe2+/Mn2+ transporter
MVLTFTSSISIAEGSAADTRTLLAGAIGCNLAWGIVDAAMYLMANLSARARGLATVRAIRGGCGDEVGNVLLLDALPPVVASVLTPVDIETMRQRLAGLPEPSRLVPLNRADYRGAAAVFLLVFFSTFPIVIPFLVIQNVAVALRASNAVAIIMMFAAGWSLGRYSGRSGWRAGLAMVALGIVLVGITVALGG